MLSTGIRVGQVDKYNMLGLTGVWGYTISKIVHRACGSEGRRASETSIHCNFRRLINESKLKENDGHSSIP
jgi:hypothetical protein